MSPELTKVLKTKYPGIFAGKYGGMDIDDGWFWLVDNLCSHLTVGDKRRGHPVIVAQIKEKFGGLRFYARETTEADNAAIYLAEHMSYSICEGCGTTKDVVSNGHGWIKTLCPPCREARNERMKR